MENIRFAHIQNTPQGTYTIGYQLDDNGAHYAIARCNPKDNFNRALGRKIVENRLKKAHSYVSFDEVGTDRYGAIVQHIVNKMSHDLPVQGTSWAERQTQNGNTAMPNCS